MVSVSTLWGKDPWYKGIYQVTHVPAYYVKIFYSALINSGALLMSCTSQCHVWYKLVSK